MDRVDETVQKIRDLEIQGASNVARESLEVLKKLATDRGFGDEFQEAAEKLKNARPTGVSAHNLIGYVLENESVEAIDEAIEYLNTSKERSAERAAGLISGGDVIMTHCHSSTVMEAFRKAKDDGKAFEVIVTETEPKLQGLKTARELRRTDVPVHYIVDSASGLFMWAADLAMVGVDAVRADGILNKIGTYLMSLAANEDPETDFYVVGTGDKFDYDGFSEIEERSPGEIRHHEQLEDPDVQIENPAFDLTPWSCVDGLVTEEKIFEDEANIVDKVAGKFEV